MLKRDVLGQPTIGEVTQPPSGGCVLKHMISALIKSLRNQPPSGGCVLKHQMCDNHQTIDQPAAFGRLCVETIVF